MAKLDERKAICLSMMEKEPDQCEMSEPKLDYEANEMFSCLVNLLKIKNNRKYGLHVVATCKNCKCSLIIDNSIHKSRAINSFSK